MCAAPAPGGNTGTYTFRHRLQSQRRVLGQHLGGVSCYGHPRTLIGELPTGHYSATDALRDHEGSFTPRSSGRGPSSSLEETNTCLVGP